MRAWKISKIFYAALGFYPRMWSGTLLPQSIGVRYWRLILLRMLEKINISAIHNIKKLPFSSELAEIFPYVLRQPSLSLPVGSKHHTEIKFVLPLQLQ